MDDFNVVRCETERNDGQGICMATVGEFNKWVNDERSWKSAQWAAGYIHGRMGGREISLVGPRLIEVSLMRH